jgi:glutamyl-tRNA reductase
MKMEASTPGSEAEHIRDLVVARTLRKLALSVEQARVVEDLGRSITERLLDGAVARVRPLAGASGRETDAWMRESGRRSNRMPRSTI